jgi:hypothetical protein
MAIICQGCGHAFDVPPDYTRNKIQCPGCGVICQVPADAASRAAPPARHETRHEARQEPAAEAWKAPRSSVEDDAAAWLRDSEPEPLPTQTHQSVTVEQPVHRERKRERDPEPVPVRKDREMTFACRKCGRPIKRQRECPVCGVEPDDPLPVDPDDSPAVASASVSAPVGLAPGSMELDEPEPMEMIPDPDEEEWNEDPSPYETAERDKPRCPRCHKEMEFDGVLCASCGFNVRTRKKAVRRYAPIARTWVTDLPVVTRWAIVGCIVGFHSLLTLGAILGGNGVAFALAYIPLFLIVGFAVGTYDSTTIIRDERGRVTIKKQWHFWFIPFPSKTTEVRGYEGVKTGGWNDSGFLEWAIFFTLFCLGIIPAFIWFYLAIYLNHYHVDLAEDHGRSVVSVYRGRTEEQMHEITKVLCGATGLGIIT